MNHRYFLVYSPRHHRALHSFPTRRSSDLLAETPAEVIWSHGQGTIRCPDDGVRKTVEALLHEHGVEIVSQETEAQSLDEIFLSRSEEHTSELQSPYDLVCRLLLEKKKKKK